MAFTGISQEDADKLAGTSYADAVAGGAAQGIAGTTPTNAAAMGQTINLPVFGDVRSNPDGTFTVLGGDRAGLNLDANMKPATVPGIGDSAHGGFDPGDYNVNADGTITIIHPPTTGNSAGNYKPGQIIGPDGRMWNPDGTPLTSGTDANGKPAQRWAVYTSTGEKATANPNYYGESDTLWDAYNLTKDVLTKDNPLAGQLNAGYDLVTGKDSNTVKNDLAQGFSSGIVGVDPSGNVVPGDVGGRVVDAAGNVVSGLGDILSGLGGGGGDSGAGNPNADAETARANALADELGGDRQKAGAQADADRALGLQTREQQQASIQQLQDAAAGKVPSVAELALTRQSGIDAARQYGLAAALQGNNPGAALRQASMGAAKVAGDTSANAAQLRAKEMADARNSLASTLSGVRTQDQGAVNTDVNQQGQAQTGQVASQGQGVTMTAAQLDAKAKEEQAKAQREGAAIGALGALGTGLLTKSDKRAKKDVAKTGLADALAKGVHGVTFEYVEPEDDREEGPQFGALAQELERVIPGAVKRRGDGIRMVDTGHLSLANTGILAELAKRLIALEGKGGKRA